MEPVPAPALDADRAEQVFPLLQAPLEPVLGAFLHAGGPHLELQGLRKVLSARRPDKNGSPEDKQAQ